MDIWGYTPFTIKAFAMEKDQSLEENKVYTLPRYESFNQMHIIGDSVLIYSAIPDEFAIKRISMDTFEKTGEIRFRTDSHPETFFYRDRGIMAANDSFIVYAYLFRKQIDIYSARTLRLLHRLVDDNAPVNIRTGDFEHTTYYYTNVVAGKDRFYAMCEEGNGTSYMEVFDYEGNPIARYRTDPVPVLFDVDERNRCIYGYSYEREDCFLKFNL